MQSVPFDNTHSDIPENQENQKPAEPVSEAKPLEQPTMPSISPESPPSPAPATTFGDILAGNTTPATAPPAPPSSDLSSSSNPSNLPSENSKPSTTFGDLLNQTVIPEPSINIPPIEPPIPPSPISPVPNQPTQQTPAAPAGGQSPVSTPTDIDQKLKEALAVRRQKANQVRMAKRQKMLDKLVVMVKEKGKYTSTEAQQKFNLPQSTLGDYFAQLVERGIIKKFGKGRGMYYTL
ncbi:helix-turn-helix transcriptional regulator [Candidatus Gottesmanbacteria bacterium]|nr:helix-turn-helix transcriptional regulator [Candidatus Gottesmanbacteria bacterium]